jgi:tRNA (cytidine/uridine-2'-O-)-methyltransferase
LNKAFIKIALVNPQIPPNTGNIARLCAANDLELHLIGKIGFNMDDKSLKRAGLDYWEYVKLFIHESFDSFIREQKDVSRMFFFSKSGKKSFFEIDFKSGDVLVFGPEDKGLPEEITLKYSSQLIGIPMQTDNVRSLNLSSAVAIAAYEAMRQIKWIR